MRGTGRGGYTLVEILVVLAVTGIVLATLAVPLQNLVQNRKVEETQRLLEQAREALLTFASAYGYLPCPADNTSGVEVATANHVTGDCGLWYGFLPAATIGFTPVDAQGFAVDAWGADSGRIRYAVSADTVGGIAMPFTRSNGMAAAGAASIGSTTNLFHICGSGSGVTPGVNCNTAQTLATNAVVVVWSVGRNGGAGGGASVHEAENPHPAGGSADRIFVSRAQSDAAGVEFDDVVTWIPATTLVSRLMASGRLP